MTRAQRRTAQRTREAAAAGLHRHSMQRAIPDMLENPNRGKHGAARLDITGERDARTMRDARRDYRPLTVRTPITRAASGRKLAARHVTETAYTI